MGKTTEGGVREWKPLTYGRRVYRTDRNARPRWLSRLKRINAERRIQRMDNPYQKMFARIWADYLE